MDIDLFVQLCKELALDAAKIQKQRLFSTVIEFKQEGVVKKNDLGTAVVSQVDREIQEMVLLRLLKEGYDDLKVFAEEDTDSLHEFSGTSSYSLFLDPIDGTLNYLLSNIDNKRLLLQKYGKLDAHPYHFGFCIGIAHHMRMEAVVMYLTTTGQLYWAIRGEGAFCGVDPVCVSLDEFTIEEEFFVNSKYHELDLLPNMMREHCTTFVISRVVCGEDLCYITQTCSLHDMIPCSLLVQEAGGIVVDEEGNSLDVIDSQKVVHQRWYVCNSRSTFEKVRSLERQRQKDI